MSAVCFINIHTSIIRACFTFLFVLFCAIRANAHIPLYSILCYQSLYHTPEDWLLVARNNATAPLVNALAPASAPSFATVTEVEVVLFEEVGGDPGSVALVAVC